MPNADIEKIKDEEMWALCAMCRDVYPGKESDENCPKCIEEHRVPEGEENKSSPAP